MNAKTIRGFLIGVALAVSAAALAQSVGYFPPPDWTWSYNGGVVAGSATGGLKGAGTINAQGLYVNNVAVTAGGVTSVGFSDNSAVPIYTIGATPVTTSGTITSTLISQSANMVFAGPTSSSAQPTFRALVAADIPAISLTAGVSGILPVANGGNGTATPTLTQGANVTITGSWPNYTIAAAGGTGCSTGNPTSVVGLTAVNGSAVSCMRTDGAPALSQAISPTMTGTWIFSPSGSSGMTINHPSAGPTLAIVGLPQVSYAAAVTITTAATTDQSNGLEIFAGTSINDASFVLRNAANTFNFFNVLGDSSWGFARDSTHPTLSGNSAGNIAIQAPSSGIAFTASAVSTNGAIRGIATVSGSNSFVASAGSATGVAYSFDTNGEVGMYQNGTNTIDFGVLGHQAVDISSVGAVSVFAPSSGVAALNVTTNSGANPGASITSGQGNTGGNADLEIIRPSGTTANAVGESANLTFADTANSTYSQIGQQGGQTEFWQFNGSWVQTAKVLTNHNWVFNNQINATGSSNSVVNYGLNGATNTGMFQGTTGFVSFACAGTTCGTLTSTTVTFPQLTSSTAATSGYVCATSGALSYDPTNTCLVSSIRFKQNVEPLNDGIGSIMKLQPVSYELKPAYNPAHLGRQVGFIAEDVAKVDPRIVPLDKDGIPRSVQYDRITALLVQGMQDQQHEIDDLRRQLAHRKH